uniref:Uncharacterized protein n=1 Tax=Solanum lycopersicum TaxID=4081 RepID=A0A3Q7JNH4_SOLLC
MSRNLPEVSTNCRCSIWNRSKIWHNKMPFKISFDVSRLLKDKLATDVNLSRENWPRECGNTSMMCGIPRKNSLNIRAKFMAWWLIKPQNQKSDYLLTIHMINSNISTSWLFKDEIKKIQAMNAEGLIQFNLQRRNSTANLLANLAEFKKYNSFFTTAINLPM